MPPGTPTPTPTPNSGPRISNAAGTFSFAVPPGWSRLEGSSPLAAVRSEAAVAGPRTRGFRDNINVVSQAAPSSLTARSAAQQTLTALRAKGYTLLTSPTAGTVAGEDAEAYGWSLPARQQSLTQVQVVTVHDGRAYFVTLSATGEDAAGLRPTLRQVLWSWRWS